MTLLTLSHSTPASSDTVDAVALLGHRLSIGHGEELYAQDDEADCVYRVVRGIVRSSRITDDGRRQIGGFYYPGDMIALEDETAHCFSAEALTDSEVIVVKRRVLDAAAASDPAIARQLWVAGTRCMRKMQSHLVQLGRKSALERVCAVLSELCARGASEEIDLPMSRQDIADYLDLTIETVSRMFSQLQARRVIAMTGLRRVRVADPCALERLAA